MLGSRQARGGGRDRADTDIDVDNGRDDEVVEAEWGEMFDERTISDKSQTTRN